MFVTQAFRVWESKKRVMSIAMVLGVAFIGVFAGLAYADAAGKSCVTPADDLNITSDTVLCSGSYTVSDVGGDGVIRVGADNVSIQCQDTTIKSSHDGSWGSGIVIGDHRGVRVEGCRIELYGNGFALRNASDVQIVNNFIMIGGSLGSEGKGLQMGSDMQVSNILISGNVFRGKGNGVSYDVNEGGSVKNFVFDGNRVESQIDGFTIGGRNTDSEFTVTNNVFTEAAGEILALHFVKGPSRVSGNIFDSPSSVLFNESRYITVDNNQLRLAHFQIEGTTDSVWNRNFISGGINIARSNEQGNAPSARNLFTNNVMDSFQSWSVRMNDATDNVFVNNTMLGANGCGVSLESESERNTFRNNIVADFGAAPAVCLDDAALAGFVADYNDYYSVDGLLFKIGDDNYTTLADWRAASGQDNHSLNVDPMLKSVQREDYHLTKYSKLINAGDPFSSFPIDDMDGDVRPTAGRYEIGADEFAPGLTINGVRVAGAVAYPGGLPEGFLVIEDRSMNADGVQYAITTDNGTTWIQADGSVGSTPYFSGKIEWRHKNLAWRTTYEYRVKARDVDEDAETSLSLCALQLSTGTEARNPGRPGNREQALDRLLNSYECRVEQ